MAYTILFLIVFICLHINFVQSAFYHIYECSEVSKYYMNDQGYYYAVLKIPPQTEGRIKIVVDIGIQGDIYYDKGDLRLYEGRNQSIINAEKRRSIFWVLVFPVSEQIPIITKISVNSFLYCRGINAFFDFRRTYEDELISNKLSRKITVEKYTNKDKPTNSSPQISKDNQKIINLNNLLARLGRRQKMPSTTFGNLFPTLDKEKIEDENPMQVPWIQNISMKCGSRNDVMEEDLKKRPGTPTIINGTEIIPGEFPWLVFLTDKSMARCGGSLVTNRIVITAAHCVKGKRKIILHFGRHNLFINNEEGSVIRAANKIIVHPKYRKDAQADIAIVTFNPIEFTDKIIPICLWPFESKIKTHHGRVAGWGRVRNNDGPSSATPRSVSLPKVSLEDCRKTDFGRQFATDDTFCAGGQNAVSCHGDSGGGFYVVRETTWYLEGIISHSSGNKYSCYPNQYAVFVDVVKYLDWLMPYLLS